MRRAFTLIELLVSLAIIGLLLGVLAPSLSRARALAKGGVCASNLRQIFLANAMYAQEHRGHSVPGAANFLANLHRWHGSRINTSTAFDSSTGPLAAYLGPERAIRACPGFDDFHTGVSAFERDCGGYGYNNTYIGVKLQSPRGSSYVIQTDRAGAMLDLIARPQQTALFADSAFAASQLIEYSFIEPRFQPGTTQRRDPSIHFRHARRANIAWADGHGSPERKVMSWSSGFYTSDPNRWDIGWFGETDDNSLFDME